MNNSTSSNSLHLGAFFKVKLLLQSRVNSIVSCPLQKNVRILCKLSLTSSCYTWYPAEVVDQVFALTILYSFDQSKMPVLYERALFLQGYFSSIGIIPVLAEFIRTDGEQDYIRTKPNKEPYHIQLVSNQNFYKRENLLNVLINKLIKEGYDCSYFLWIDPHQIFTNTYWWEQAIYKMSKYPAVQLFQNLELRSFTNDSMMSDVLSCSAQNVFLDGSKNHEAPIWGNGWGISLEFYNEIEYIADLCIVGCCDCIYCFATRTIPNVDIFQGDGYFKHIVPWLKKARQVMQNRSTFVPGHLIHFKHERSFDYTNGITYFQQHPNEFDFRKDLLRNNETMELIVINDTLRKLLSTFSIN